MSACCVEGFIGYEKEDRDADGQIKKLIGSGFWEWVVVLEESVGQVLRGWGLCWGLCRRNWDRGMVDYYCCLDLYVAEALVLVGLVSVEWTLKTRKEWDCPYRFFL